MIIFFKSVKRWEFLKIKTIKETSNNFSEELGINIEEKIGRNGQANVVVSIKRVEKQGE